jgi:predicted ester cyclase
MSPQEMKAKVRYYLTEIWCNDNLDVLDEVLHPGFVAHSNPPQVGMEAVKQSWKSGILEALSERKVEFPHQIVEGDLIATHIIFTGKHINDLAGVKPTGNIITLKSTAIQRFQNGLLAEGWPFPDTLGMMQQLGYKLTLEDS